MARDHHDEAAAICAISDCWVAKTGRCVEGLELSACPHYGREPEETSESGRGSENKFSAPSSVTLPGAGSLNLGEASRLLCRGEGPSDRHYRTQRCRQDESDLQLI